MRRQRCRSHTPWRTIQYGQNTPRRAAPAHAVGFGSGLQAPRQFSASWPCRSLVVGSLHICDPPEGNNSFRKKCQTNPEIPVLMSAKPAARLRASVGNPGGGLAFCRDAPFARSLRRLHEPHAGSLATPTQECRNFANDWSGCSPCGGDHMEFNQIRYFLALCEEDTFCRAAKTCGVTQPSLTNAIKRLEQDVGGALFSRRPKVQPTPLALALKPHLERALASIHLAQREAIQMLKEQRRPTRRTS